MKILSVSHLYVVGALLLGLFVAWGATMPQLTTGEQLGGCREQCTITSNPYCASKDGGKCLTRHEQCTGSGDLTCFVLSGAGSQPCQGDSNCDNDLNENCN